MAVLFDLDGTLVSTDPECRYTIVENTLRDLGIGGVSRGHIDSLWFRANRNALLTESFGVTPEVFWPAFNKHDTAEIRERFTRPYEDVEVLRELKEKGKKIGIVTGAPIRVLGIEIELVARKVGVDFHDLFDVIIPAKRRYGTMEKPDPAGLLKCCDILRLDWSRVPYIGNSDEDIMAAKAAGMLDVFIDRGEHSFEHPHPPTHIIKTLYELRELVY